MVVGVTVAVAAVLGYQAYTYSTGQTQLVNIERMEHKGEQIDEQFIADLEAYARAEDHKVLLGVLGGIALLALALGVTGIVVTHRLVGPAFRLKQLIRHVSDGHLHVQGKLRKHDELQDVFEAFQQMVTNLRAARELELSELDAAISRARAAGASDETIAALRSVRERIQSSLG
jgi:nitrogen fixation/metabolism regulation signal transduction histidine kinase